MGDKSKIEWTEATWNPVVGCSKVSPGCAHCYAEELHRTRLDGKGVYPEFRPWTPANADHNVTLVPERLEQPLRWTKPRMIFVNSMSDLFHPNVPNEYVLSVFRVMAQAPQHTFQVLTKRPDRMRDFCLALNETILPFGIEAVGGADPPLLPPLPNVWLGTSIEYARYAFRADHLRETPAAVRFVSAEPLLGRLLPQPTGDEYLSCIGCGWSYPIETTTADERCSECGGRLAAVVEHGKGLDLAGIDWLIVGGESGPKRRRVDPEWVRELRDAALATPCPRDTDGDGACSARCHAFPRLPGHHSTAFFFKQWGGRTPKAGGRELDGRTWDEMPVVSGNAAAAVR